MILINRRTYLEFTRDEAEARIRNVNDSVNNGRAEISRLDLLRTSAVRELDDLDAVDSLTRLQEDPYPTWGP